MGVDIGGTNTILGAVTRGGEVAVTREFATEDFPHYRSYIQRLIQELSDLIDEAQGTCHGIGIGAPNGNIFSGAIENAANLPFGAKAPVVDDLRLAFDLPYIQLTNDANAAAMGEMVYGGAQGIRDFIMITLGTGLGSGIVVGGEVVYGHDGMAGELGHTCAVPDGRLCGCGSKGCLETYASARGIVRNFLEMAARHGRGATIMGDWPLEDLNAKDIAKAAAQGDHVALDAFKMTGQILGASLANFVAFSSPAAIFLFGGPVNAGELLLHPTRKALDKNVTKLFRNKVSVLPSGLPGSQAAILGAAALVWHEDERPAPHTA